MSPATHRRISPLLVPALLGLSAIVVVLIGGAPARSQSTPLPDLIVVQSDLEHPRIQVQTFAADSCAVVEGYTDPGTQRLLRFTTTYPNIGTADLVIGNPTGNPLFELSQCHNHLHFKEYADYRLWSVAGYDAWVELKAANPDALSKDLLSANPSVVSQMIRGDKRGFCVIDVIRYRIPGVRSGMPTYTSCATNQGISVGWADQYGALLDGQWIVVTNVPAGSYVLEVEVNAEHLFQESNYGNNSSAAVIAIRR